LRGSRIGYTLFRPTLVYDGRRDKTWRVSRA